MSFILVPFQAGTVWADPSAQKEKPTKKSVKKVPRYLNGETKRFSIVWEKFEKNPSPETLQSVLDLEKIAPSVINKYPEFRKIFLSSLKRLCRDGENSYQNGFLLARFFFEFPRLDHGDFAKACKRSFLYNVDATSFHKRWLQFAINPNEETYQLLLNVNVSEATVDHPSIAGDLIRVMETRGNFLNGSDQEERQKSVVYFDYLKSFFEKKPYFDRPEFAAISGRPMISIDRSDRYRRYQGQPKTRGRKPSSQAASKVRSKSQDTRKIRQGECAGLFP